MSYEKVAISDLGQIITGKTPRTKNLAFFDGKYQTRNALRMTLNVRWCLFRQILS